jgi:hypothetical protein
MIIEATVQGKRRDAVAAAALDACKTLDARGVLRGDGAAKVRTTLMHRSLSPPLRARPCPALPHVGGHPVESILQIFSTHANHRCPPSCMSQVRIAKRKAKGDDDDDDDDDTFFDRTGDVEAKRLRKKRQAEQGVMTYEKLAERKGKLVTEITAIRKVGAHV